MTDTEQFARCVECSEEIVEDARKCKHCGAYQRRSYSWSGAVVTILSLLVAVISLVLGGIDQFRDLVYPRTPLFAVIEPVTSDDQFLVSTYDVSLLVHNESDDSVVLEDMVCFRSYTPDVEDLNFLDAIWANDASSIIPPAHRNNSPYLGEALGACWAK